MSVEEELKKESLEYGVGAAGTATKDDPQVLLGAQAEGMFALVKQLVRASQPTRRFTFGRLLGVIATAMPFPSFRCDFGVIIKAEATNLGNIYIGDRNVTAAAGVRIGGFELDANQAIILPVRELSDLYMYDTPGGQYACFIAM